MLIFLKLLETLTSRQQLHKEIDTWVIMTWMTENLRKHLKNLLFKKTY